MNSTATLEKISGLRSGDALSIVGNWLKTVRSAISIAFPDGRAGSGNRSSRRASSYLLGAPVQHGQFGIGEVVAHWPDGTLLVRFKREGTIRLVWPSLLDPSNNS